MVSDSNSGVLFITLRNLLFCRELGVADGAPYLGADRVISAVQQRADVLQVQANAVHSSIISDIAVDEGSN